MEDYSFEKDNFYVESENLQNINEEEFFYKTNSDINFKKKESTSFILKNYIHGVLDINKDNIDEKVQILGNRRDIHSIEILINDNKINTTNKIQFDTIRAYSLYYNFTKFISNISNLFYECSSLTFLDLSNFSSINTINMSNLFNGCNNLTYLNLSNLNTQKVTDMSFMFNDCFSLTNLNVSSFITDNVTNMSNMFCHCKSLKELNLSNFNTLNVVNMSDMFRNCSSLTKLNLFNFKTNNVINMSYMFYQCNNLELLNINNFNTFHLMYMNHMFFNCSKLFFLNLSSFNINKVNKLNDVFKGINHDIIFIIKDQKLLKELKKSINKEN
jgi:surface protein